jgi:pimeloyl-ACP methyl ester carboxylesterase
LKKINAPTLILWGAKDRILSMDNALVFEKLMPHSKKIIFEGIGHMPMLEVPEKTAQVYKDFLSSM